MKETIDDQNLSNIMKEHEEKNEEKSDLSSSKLSEFFTRNKSLKILVNSDAIRP